MSGASEWMSSASQWMSGASEWMNERCERRNERAVRGNEWASGVKEGMSERCEWTNERAVRANKWASERMSERCKQTNEWGVRGIEWVSSVSQLSCQCTLRKSTKNRLIENRKMIRWQTKMDGTITIGRRKSKNFYSYSDPVYSTANSSQNITINAMQRLLGKRLFFSPYLDKKLISFSM